MLKKTGIIILWIIIANNSLGQDSKEFQTFEQVWLSYFNQTRFSGRWGMWFDLQLRTEDNFFTGLSTGIIRVGLTYYLNDQAKLTAGYAYANYFPAEGHKNVSQPEHRPWQQFQWHNNHKKIRTMQWVRLEERFTRKLLNDDELADGYNFNFRLRYNFVFQVALDKRAFQPGTFSFVANEELMVNFGKEIVYNTFDQNRIFLGLGYHVNKSDNLRLGYMLLFQQLASGYQYRILHAIRVAYYHNLDLRK